MIPNEDFKEQLRRLRTSNHDLRNKLCAASLRGSALQRRGKVAVAALREVAAELATTVGTLRGRLRA